MDKASELSGPHASTNLCDSSLCVSMICFETVLAFITALLTNCGPFNRRSSMGVEIEACLLQLLMRRQQSSVLNNQALTLLCVIWTEAHTSRQVKMTVWPYFHGFAMVLNNWFGSSVANLTHGH